MNVVTDNNGLLRLDPPGINNGTSFVLQIKSPFDDSLKFSTALSQGKHNVILGNKPLMLGLHMNNVIVLTMTEFGRTAKQNGSHGTDHGNASTWFVIGKSSLQGGIYLGTGGWPGLGTDQLYQGRY